MNFLELGAKLSLDSSDYERGLGRAKGLASKLGSGIRTAMKIGAAAIGVATTAAVAFGAASVKTGMEFDKSMSQVAATMGMTLENLHDPASQASQDFQRLRDFAQEMGRTTAFSARESADALNYMALAGYDVDESIAMLPNVMNLAAAGSIDLARASDMVTDASTAFGLSVKENGPRIMQMVDEMAKAASTGNTSVEQLGDAFLTIGANAQELNGGMIKLKDGTMAETDGIQELEIALTAMANAGIKGSEAGTHMRNMITKLSKPTSDGTKQLEALGVSVFDAEGNMRSMGDVMTDFSDKLGEMTQEDRIKAVADLFNVRDMASAKSLMNAVTGEYVKFGDQILTVDDAYKQFGEDIYDTNKGFEYVQTSWDDIGESILNAKGAADEMAKVQLDNLAGDITLFKSALEGAKIAISDQLTPSLREFVQFGTDGVSRLTEAFKSDGLSGAMEEFGKLLSEGLSMIVEGLPGAIEAGGKLLSALGEGILQNLPLLTSTAVEIITMMTSYLLESAPQVINAGLDILLALADGITQNLPTIIPVVADVVTQIVTSLTENASAFLEAAIGIINALADGLSSSLPQLIPTIVEVVLEIVDTLTNPSTLSSLVDAAIEIIFALADGLMDALPQLIERLPEIVQNLVDGIIENAPKLIDAAIELVESLTDGLMESLPTLIGQLPDVIGRLVAGLIENAPALIDAGIELILALTFGLIEALPQLIEQLPEIVSQLVDGLIANAPMLLSAAWQLIYQLTLGIIRHLPDVFAKGQEIVNKVVQGIAGLFNVLVAKGGEIVTKIGNGLRGAFSKVLQWGRDLVGKVVSGIGNAASDLWDAGMDIVKGIWSGISNGYSWITGRIRGWVGDVTSFFKRILGISSPSKVYRDQIGKWLARGIGVGFVNEMSAVEKMMAEAMPDPNGFVDSDTLFGSKYEYHTISDGDYSYANSRLDSELLNILLDIRDNIGTELYLDDGTLIGWIDQSLGRKASQRIRGNA